MQFSRSAVLFCALAALAVADELSSVLARMDESAAAFKAMSANVRRVYHTAVINDDTVDGGAMWVKRVKPKDLKMLIKLTEPASDPRAISVDGRKAELYFPKINTVQEYDIGQNKGLVDQFMLLGFGTSSKDLQSAYSIRYVGAKEIGGEPAAQLELIPKDPKVLQRLSKVELWVSQKTGYPVQQQFMLPGGDYQLVTFANVKMLPNLSDSELKLQIPKGVKRESPQKQ